MANTSSGLMLPGRTYKLGSYVISIQKTNPAEETTVFTAHITASSAENTKSITVNKSVGLYRWYVESNDTTADVYVTYDATDSASQYGSDETKLVARFSIDLTEAGGSGTGSDWNNPGDGGDPSYTLELTINGALSGRHNDPLHDPSYSYVPADQDSKKNYGCGGDGGHGGGGGAGASTIIVKNFATDKAGSKIINAYAKRHGYGSGGGKGGRGGDGCILIYY